MNEIDSNDHNFTIECSDDDNYENNEDNYRIVSGKKIWEPNGQLIANLYRQLEAKGFIELRWQCPGRRSPSVHNYNANDRQKIESADNENNSSDKSNDLMTEFDFETESQLPAIGSKSGQNPLQRRRTTGLKLQTNLTKVMADIKKYQLIDQKGKKVPNFTTTGATTTTTTANTTPTVTRLPHEIQSDINSNELSLNDINLSSDSTPNS